jgi:hypothetical protein
MNLRILSHLFDTPQRIYFPPDSEEQENRVTQRDLPLEISSVTWGN